MAKAELTSLPIPSPIPPPISNSTLQIVHATVQNSEKNVHVSLPPTPTGEFSLTTTEEDTRGNSNGAGGRWPLFGSTSTKKVRELDS